MSGVRTSSSAPSSTWSRPVADRDSGFAESHRATWVTGAPHTTRGRFPMTESPTAKERAQNAAGTATDEGRHLAGVTQQEAGNVASEAANQARRVMDDAISQVSSQSKEQQDRLAGTLRTIGDDLESKT